MAGLHNHVRSGRVTPTCSAAPCASSSEHMWPSWPADGRCCSCAHAHSALASDAACVALAFLPEAAAAAHPSTESCADARPRMHNQYVNACKTNRCSRNETAQHIASATLLQDSLGDHCGDIHQTTPCGEQCVQELVHGAGTRRLQSFIAIPLK